jgi:transposase
MDRSTIHSLKQKGWTNTQIAEFMGHHRDTSSRVLREPVDKQPAARPRESQVAAFTAQIEAWLEQGLSVQRMLELARADTDHPYQGSDVAFYVFVRPLRRARAALPTQVAVRFEGLPGELLQIDWGELRQMPFTQPQLVGQTRYFFAARLKYSRWMCVRFTRDMQEETLLCCLIACFVHLDGVPGVVTSDNRKTITLGGMRSTSRSGIPPIRSWRWSSPFIRRSVHPAPATRRALWKIWSNSSKPTSWLGAPSLTRRTWRRSARRGSSWSTRSAPVMRPANDRAPCWQRSDRSSSRCQQWRRIMGCMTACW